MNSWVNDMPQKKRNKNISCIAVCFYVFNEMQMPLSHWLVFSVVLSAHEKAAQQSTADMLGFIAGYLLLYAVR